MAFSSIGVMHWTMARIIDRHRVQQLRFFFVTCWTDGRRSGSKGCKEADVPRFPRRGSHAAGASISLLPRLSRTEDRFCLGSAAGIRSSDQTSQRSSQ
mmetsp:Transcript_19699/g.63323  ORF Transcript_19699/g.63323 Transcript_19699/m.63323 type:complete len:98 (-) Transcript_19699:8-301(-)